MLRTPVMVAALALAACSAQPPVFRIDPVRPVAELRAQALAATPHGSHRRAPAIQRHES